MGWSRSNNATDQTVPAIILKLAKDSLRGIISKKLRGETSVSEKQKMRWSNQIADAVDYMHLKNLIHRDLKPANVLIGDDDEIKLVGECVTTKTWSVYCFVLTVAPRVG